MTAPLLPGQSSSASVKIENLGQPGAFEIRVSDAPISLATQAFVEKQTASGWTTVASNLILAEACPAGDPPKCIERAAGSKLRPAPWNGYSCSGQCNVHCKKNVYLGSGPFRLTVLSCDRKARFHSATFHLPATANP